MIKLKDKINKSVALRTIRRYAEKIYKESWQPELQIEAYVKGAEAILNYLHIPRVRKRKLNNYPMWVQLLGLVAIGYMAMDIAYVFLTRL